MVLKIKIAGLTIYKILNHLSVSVLAASVDTSLAQLKKVQTKIKTKYKQSTTLSSWPTLFWASTLTPCSTRYLITPLCPCLAAQYTALSPCTSTAPRSAPWPFSTCSISSLPRPAAIWTPLSPCLLAWFTSILATLSNSSRPDLLSSSIAQKMAESTKLSSYNSDQLVILERKSVWLKSIWLQFSHNVCGYTCGGCWTQISLWAAAVSENRNRFQTLTVVCVVLWQIEIQYVGETNLKQSNFLVVNSVIVGLHFFTKLIFPGIRQIIVRNQTINFVCREVKYVNYKSVYSDNKPMIEGTETYHFMIQLNLLGFHWQLFKNIDAHTESHI